MKLRSHNIHDLIKTKKTEIHRKDGGKEIISIDEKTREVLKGCMTE